MSNLINNFPAKLTAVIHKVAKNGSNVYTAHFEDGTHGVIRTSSRAYAAVSQIGTLGERTDFVFASKAQPSLGKWQQARCIAIVQVLKEEAAQVENT